MLALNAPFDMAIGATGATPNRWEALRRDDLRVAGVTYRLSLGNRERCRAALTPQLGFVMHSVEQYGPAERNEAARVFGLDAHPGVMAVVADSAAARAGLRANDRLLSVNGRAFDLAPADMASPTNARTEAARELLLDKLAKGAVTLRVSSAEGERTVRFTAETGCPTNVELVPGPAVNAWADGRGVVVSAGLLAQCRSDDDLAVAIGHELAHNLLHHRARLARLGLGTSALLLTAGAGSAEMRVTEEEADALGVQLAAMAGYDLSGATSFLDRLQSGRGMDAESTHPAPGRRLALLTAAIAAARQ